MYSIMPEDNFCYIHNLDAMRRVLAPVTFTHEPRDPSRTILYTVVTEHLQIFLPPLRHGLALPHEARMNTLDRVFAGGWCWGAPGDTVPKTPAQQCRLEFLIPLTYPCHCHYDMMGRK